MGDTSKSLKIEDGVRAYKEHVARPKVLRGCSLSTQKRYRPVFDKFLPFLAARGVTSWQQVTRSVLVSYGGWLEKEGYAYRTQSLELTTIVQAVKWMKAEKLLAQDHALHVSMAKPSADSDTYCYTPPEVVAMTTHCFASPDLHWLGGLIVTLSLTGMRIDEAVQLVWSSVDFSTGILHVRDDSKGGSRKLDNQRTTKSSRSRRIGLHQEVVQVLKPLSASMSKHERVFSGPLGGKLKADTVRNILIRDVLKPVSQQLYPNNPTADFLTGRLHSFRHYFCTACYRAGLSEREILDLMGHTSSAITLRYRHLSVKDHQETIAKLTSVTTRSAKEQDVVAHNHNQETGLKQD